MMPNKRLHLTAWGRGGSGSDAKTDLEQRMTLLMNGITGTINRQGER
jgi:hypothetical protein